MEAGKGDAAGGVGKTVITEKLLDHSQLQAAFLHVVGHVHYPPRSWE